ncbi:GEVED domain-containing protein [Coprobacter sp.]
MIHIYGHDHGSDNAYIRTETSQRITQYDTDGNLYTIGNVEQSSGLFYVQNSKTNKYLGRTATSDNVDTFTEPMTVSITPSSTAGMFNFVLTTTTDEKNLYCGSSGRFSGNRALSDLWLYEVVTNDNGAVTAKQVTTSVESGKSYLIVGQKNGAYYALTNEPYSSGLNFRLIGAQVSVSGEVLTYSDTNTSDDFNAVWNVTEKQPDVNPDVAAPSFISAFAGSMRYYNNSFDSGSSVNDSKVAQALMVYVYQDSVVLQMRNYGQSGLINGINIQSIPASYKSVRKVTNTGVVETQRTVSVESNNEELGTVEITNPEIEEKTVFTEAPVTVNATVVDALAEFVAWIDSEGTEISTANPFTYTGKNDITLIAQFKKKGYPEIRHTFEVNKQQENRFLDRVTYTTTAGTKELFDLNLGTGTLSAFPENINIVSGESAIISYLEPLIEVKEGDTSFDLTCYSTHSSIVVNGVTYKNNMTWVNQCAFVDWNNDLDFSDAGEKYAATEIEMSSSSTNPPVHPFRLASGYTRTITIPENTPVGIYRMYLAYGQDGAPLNWSFDEMFSTKTISRGNVYEFNISVLPKVPLALNRNEEPLLHAYISGNVLYIKGLSERSVVNVMDCTGRLLISKTSGSETDELYLPYPVQGIYLVKIVSEGNSVSIKLAK